VGEIGNFRGRLDGDLIPMLLVRRGYRKWIDRLHGSISGIQWHQDMFSRVSCGATGPEVIVFVHCQP
jgi:hypothetical protein